MTRLCPLIFMLAACDGDLAPTDTASPVDRSAVRTCDVSLSASLPEGVREGAVSGTFSDWNPLPLDGVEDGVGTLELGRLLPGTYAYKFVWDGTYEGAPPIDVPSTWDGGVENRALVVGDCTRPTLEALEATATADGSVDAELLWTRGEDGASLDTVEARIGGVQVQAEVRDDGIVHVAATGLPRGKHTVLVQAWDTEGREAEGGPVFLPLWVQDSDFAWGDGVLYFAFVDRFRDGGPSPESPIEGAAWGTNYRGGDLAGLRDALEEGYLDDLGVRSIWLSPVVDNPDGAWLGSSGDTRYTGYHGYWPTTPRTVEGRFGTVDTSADQALLEVVDAAHARGIRVVFDVVLNHVHEQHPWITSHPDWFDLADPCVCGSPGCGWEEKPRTCRFASYLPDVEYRNQGAVDAMIDEVRWWLRTYDLDGLRVDAAKHMDHVILRTLSYRLRQEITDPGAAPVYLVGETFTGSGQQGLIAEYIGPHELDGQFDFPVYWQIRGTLHDGGSFRNLAGELAASDATYGDQLHAMSVFYGNHDVPRLATELAGCDTWELFGGCSDPLGDGPADRVTEEQAWLVDRIALAWALVATQPGPPLLYYGDEYGLAGSGDPDNRRDMPWEDLSAAQLELRDRVSALALLRASDPALQRGDREVLHVEDDFMVLARTTPEQGSAIAWFSRFADGARTVSVPARIAPEGTVLVDGLSGVEHTVEGGVVRINADPWSYGVLVRP